MISDWIEISRGDAPLIVSIPHTGTDIPAEIESRLISPWLARKDADWHIERLYYFASSLCAMLIRTRISRTVIDVNRDPSGVSLYPGQSTTELCPTTTFDGGLLYRGGDEPTSDEIASRRSRFFDPYHAAIVEEIQRLRSMHQHIVLYDCHSIRSVIPRLFEGELPNINIGTDSGRSCAPRLTADVERVLSNVPMTKVVNGRFRGGYITRYHGRPADGVHAIQMELAIRGYAREPIGPVDETNWPPPYDPEIAAPMRATLERVLRACQDFALSTTTSVP